jgi:hypothetical protein
LLNDDGTYGTAKANSELGDINSPYSTIQQADRYTKKYRVLANAFAEVSFVKELKLRVNYAFDGTLNRGYNFNIADANQVRQNPASVLTQTEEEISSQLLEAFLTYDKVFGKSHVTFTGGYSYQNFKDYGFAASRIGYDDTDPAQRVLSTGNAQFNSSTPYPFQPSALQSGFARLFYDFDSRFLATVTFRADGSSRFAKGNQWGYFPAFSLGWRLSNEQFIKNISWINNLKLTGGYGELGQPKRSTLPVFKLNKNRFYLPEWWLCIWWHRRKRCGCYHNCQSGYCLGKNGDDQHQLRGRFFKQQVKHNFNLV